MTATNAPTGLNVTKNGDTITVSWTPPTPTPTGYDIYYIATEGGIDIGNTRVTNGLTDQLELTRRIRVSYDVTMVALSQHLPSTVVGPISTTREWLHMYYTYICRNQIILR